MKNGTSDAVLVRDLLAGDGPFVQVAEDFLRQRCTRCGIDIDDDVRFHQRGYFCAACWTLVREIGPVVP